jgi:CheY-like chemotaxis protein
MLARTGADKGEYVNELPVVLVIEDEYAIQGIVEDPLTEGGFGTDILSSGEEALTLFRGGLKNYKALVTDVALKGRLNGWEVAAQIRETDPGFPVVYMSGAHVDEWTPRRREARSSVKAGTASALISDHERKGVAARVPQFHVLGGTKDAGELQRHPNALRIRG